MCYELSAVYKHLLSGRSHLNSALSELGNLLVKDDIGVKEFYDQLFELMCSLHRITDDVKRCIEEG
jgi:hypothetical protein